MTKTQAVMAVSLCRHAACTDHATFLHVCWGFTLWKYKLALMSLSNHNMKTLSLFNWPLPPFCSSLRRGYISTIYIKSTAHLHKINNHTSK